MMIRLLFVVISTVLSSAFVLSLDASLVIAEAGDATNCFKGHGKTQVQACSSIIKSGRIDGRPISKNRLATVYTTRGSHYAKMARFDLAVADFRKAVALRPGDPKASAMLKSLEVKLAAVIQDKDAADCTNKQSKNRIRGCTRIIKSGRIFGRPINKEGLSHIYYNRGRFYAEERQYSRAVGDYKEAIKLNPKFAKAYSSRAAAYGLQGLNERAIADLRTVLKLRPGDPKTKAMLKLLGVKP